MKIADKGQRLGNFIFDTIIVLLFVIPICVLYTEKREQVIFAMIYILYSMIFESITSRTLGKLLTHTKVVDKNNQKPAFWKIFIRSIFRFFPFDIFSFLFGYGVHDIISGTRVISLRPDKIKKQ